MYCNFKKSTRKKRWKFAWWKLNAGTLFLYPLASSVLAQSPQYCDGTVTVLEITFGCFGKVKVNRCKFFQYPRLHLRMTALCPPLLPCSCLWNGSPPFPCEFVPLCALGPSCLFWKLTPSGAHALLYLPALLSWDLQACLNLPHPSKHIPQARYSLTLLTSTPFSFYY